MFKVRLFAAAWGVWASFTANGATRDGSRGTSTAASPTASTCCRNDIVTKAKLDLDVLWDEEVDSRVAQAVIDKVLIDVLA